jgi:hypothetical protein
MHPLPGSTMVGDEQQPDDDLRDNQRLGESKAMRDQCAAAGTSPAMCHEREDGGNQTDSDDKECQRVVHR